MTRSLALLLACMLIPAIVLAGGDPLDRSNVVWTSPSLNSSGSMPLGNGDIGLNVWVEQDGDLLFYISKTDAWSDSCRLLKLGRVRVKLSPNPFMKGLPFVQTLRLHGVIGEHAPVRSRGRRKEFGRRLKQLFAPVFE